MGFLVVFSPHCAAADLSRVEQASPDTRTIVVAGEGKVAFVELDSGPDQPSSDATQSVCQHGHRLIGRIRLDGREELCLTIPGAPTRESDAHLCLRAYARWGEGCVERLKGDFCFVVWDEERQQLFGVRDQLGVRPLFYAVAGTTIIVSDSIDPIATKSIVSNELDDYWIADFLISGVCSDLDRTVYKGIKRLPPAHYLTAARNSFAVRRYWRLAVGDPIQYRDPRHYIDHFHDVLARSIEDRLPQGRIGISMSGGLDSATLAAQTLKVTDASRLVAHTCYFKELMPDEEKHFSSVVANTLGIQIVHRAVDDLYYDPHWRFQELRTPEPCADIVRAVPQRLLASEMANLSQVWFYGEGPDNALVFEWQSYLSWLFGKRDWYSFGNAIVQYARTKPLREWGATIHQFVLRRGTATPDRQFGVGVPPWLCGEFVRELDLATRARQPVTSAADLHPWHPRAVANLTGPLWPDFFNCFDTSNWGVALTYRHPYLDLRVLTFLLSVPPIPWARHKRLIRKAMRGVLPDEVLRRKKTPLALDPEALMLQKYGLPPLARDGPISRYVDHSRVPTAPPAVPARHPLLNIHVLDAWLESRRRLASNVSTRQRTNRHVLN